MNTAFQELLALRGLEPPTEAIDLVGQDPVLSTRFTLGETSAAVFAAIGVGVNDLWQLQTGRRQDLSVNLSHAAAALRSYNYFNVEESAAGGQGHDARAASINWALQQQRQRISTPHPTRDGRYFLPHMGLPHLAQRALDVLKCDYELESVINAVAGWDALALEEAIAAVGGCGAMVRSAAEWASHPQGQAHTAQPRP